MLKLGYTARAVSSKKASSVAGYSRWYTAFATVNKFVQACLKLIASFYQTQELLLMIHDESMAIADNTEALADEESLTENSEAPECWW